MESLGYSNFEAAYAGIMTALVGKVIWPLMRLDRGEGPLVPRELRPGVCFLVTSLVGLAVWGLYEAGIVEQQIKLFPTLSAGLAAQAAAQGVAGASNHKAARGSA